VLIYRADAAKLHDIKESWRKLAAQWNGGLRNSIPLADKHSNPKPRRNPEKQPKLARNRMS
jgi:hypothetical protein